MKILEVTALYPPHIGGIENHVETLSKNLVELGHDVTVYTSNIPKSKNYEKCTGIEIYRFHCYFSPLNNQFTPGIFLKLIKNNDFDIIHIHSHLHLSSNIAAFANIFKKNSIILTSHGTGNYVGWKNALHILYNKTIGKWMLRSADKIIALTPQQAKILESLGATHDIVDVIPHGIDLNKIELAHNLDKIKESYGLSGRMVILFVGALIPRKGVNYLIDAMEFVNSDAVLLIIGGELLGNKDFKITLENQVKRKKLENVIFLGRIPQEELELIYAMADIFVLPSLSEGLPLTLLEAMAYKKCVIATNIPGNSDLIINNFNGILYNPRDPLYLSKIINYLLENPTVREKLSKNARADIEKNYSLDVSLKKTLNLYKEVIVGNKKRKRD